VKFNPLALLRDAVGLGGAVLIVNGVFMLSRPAGYIVGGGMLLLAALLLARGE